MAVPAVGEKHQPRRPVDAWQPGRLPHYRVVGLVALRSNQPAFSGRHEWNKRAPGSVPAAAVARLVRRRHDFHSEFFGDGEHAREVLLLLWTEHADFLKESLEA